MAAESCATCNACQAVELRNALTTDRPKAVHQESMSDVVRIHSQKQPRRPHHVAEWAEMRGLTQADIARELGADKSVVSRWFAGSTPGLDYQARLAALFGCEPEALFRHPDDDWLARFFADRERDEIERIKKTLEAAFPRKTA